MLRIDNARILTGDPDLGYLASGSVLADTRAGRIVAVLGAERAGAARAHAPADEVFDAGGRLLVPGAVNAHTHLYGTFARGMALAGPPPRSFGEVLERLWWKLDRALTPEDVRLSARYGCAQAIKAGCTTIIDHHASPGRVSTVEGSLDLVAEAALEIGPRAVLCYETSDRDGEAIAQAGIAENLRFARRVRGDAAGNRLGAAFGLHAQLTLGDATLERCAAAMAEAALPAHVHVAEGENDRRDALARSGAPAVTRLMERGCLPPGSIAAHCVHVDEAEIARLADQGVWVVHNAQSNQNNAVGAAPVEALLARGVRVCIGTDGMTQDPRLDCKAAVWLAKHRAADPSAGWGGIQEAWQVHTPALGSALLGVPLGRIAPGAAADLVVLDYFPPTPLGAENAFGHLLFGMAEAPVRDVFVGGRRVLAEGRLTGVDERELAARCQGAAEALWRRL